MRGRKKKLTEDHLEDGKGSLLHEFALIRKKLLIMSLISLGLTFTSLAIVGLKLLYPFHVIIGISLYVLSFVPLVRRIYFSRKAWKKYRAYRFTKKFYKKEKRRLFLALALVVGSVVFLWIRPLDDNPFTEYSDAQIVQLVNDDLYESVVAMDYLETTGNTLLVDLANTSSDANVTKQTHDAFGEFLNAVSFSESLTERHRYFASLPYRLWNERVNSFLISYSLYVKKYEIVHRVMMGVSGNEYQKKVLNQYIPSVDSEGVYNEMVMRFYSPKTRLRLSGGYLYMKLFSTSEATRTGTFEMLYAKASGSYSYLRSNFFSTILHSGEVLVDHTERNMFDTWFPIQKNVANTMGHIILTNRGKDGFITPEQAYAMEESMRPGDFMLQRRNWHLSNVGIPGFWTHAALYSGSLATMEEYFASEFPYEGYETLSSYMQAKSPIAYAIYTTPDKDGGDRAVIEAIEPGVVLQSLPVSADADFVVVLRPNLLSKHDTFLALLKAFAHVGKQYDYDFDFDTLDTLVCSELVYDAYFENMPEKQGVHFETSVVSGRKIVSPLDMAKKFVAEHGTKDAELSFVYFLRGNEKTRTAKVASEQDFIKSVGWSKFTFLQQGEEDPL